MEQYLTYLAYDYVKRYGCLGVAAGQHADMVSVVALFRRIDSGVRNIQTFSGPQPDAYYTFDAGNWKARYPLTRRRRNERAVV